MNKHFTLTLLLTALSPAAFAQNKTPSRPKIPHSHHSAQGGAVLMFGDDHVEIAKTSEGKTLFVFFSDKLRDPLKSTDFAFDVSLVDGTQVTKLSSTANAKSPFELKIELPKKIGAAAEIEIKALRQNARSGYVTSDRPQRMSLSKIPAMPPMDHSAHSGH